MSGRSKLLVACLIAALLGAVAVMAAGRFGRQEQGTPLKVGALVPDFTLTDLDSRAIGPQQWRGKVVVLAFWASWCPACRSEMPSLEELHRQLAPVGKVVGINGGEPIARVKAFMAEMNLTFPVALDVRGEVHSLYRVTQYPVTFVVDPQGRLVARHVGARDWSKPETVAQLRLLATAQAEGEP